jgi:hypothetical protein
MYATVPVILVYLDVLEPGLWIHIHFFTDPDPDPDLDAGDQYGSGSNTDPGFSTVNKKSLKVRFNRSTTKPILCYSLLFSI